MGMRKIFIGMGAYTNNGVVTGSTHIAPIVSNFMDLMDSKDINTIGAYRGDLGLYLEEFKMIDYKGQTFEDLIKNYPNEEAFLIADVVSFTEVGGDFKETLSNYLLNLDYEKGFSLVREDKKKQWCLLITTQGELLCRQ